MSREEDPAPGRDERILLPFKQASDDAPCYESIHQASADERLPKYSTSIAVEGVFQRKLEIENTILKAKDRRWRSVLITLNGTALQIYSVRKDWALSLTRDSPHVSPDNPPWLRKGKLKKTYSLLHADAGIAADYKKRRYVIRIRAETDQFLISCIELSTFIKWLECLFAAIDVAAPIDDRDFPKDMSIPRVQRSLWRRDQTGADATPTDPRDQQSPSPSPSQDAQSPTAGASNPSSPNDAPPEPTPSPVGVYQERDVPDFFSSRVSRLRPRRGEPLDAGSSANPAVDPRTGKWLPEHRWTAAHDLLYAKLCYNVLLFSSPRKSDFVIRKGKQWFVDWSTGDMTRVLPPPYRERDHICTVKNCTVEGHPDEE
ncbi:Uncharacterized protein ESCO_000196 [Escovopsis weberi]|uniref:Pleckstrin homology domain-containing protein n=1 Tax=Escovopsis weberi TaxID=150374 RepID=A0A0M9VTE0_ESCWE|nr:Uncharacterized protein ESCO_000196 [Escovopsis weberi]